MTDERPIVLYGKRGCPQCDAARAFLQAHGATFREVDLTRAEAAEPVREVTNAAGHSVLPVIVIDRDVQVGFDAARVEEMLSTPLPPEEDQFPLPNLHDDEEEEEGDADETCAETAHTSSGTAVVSVEAGEGAVFDAGLDKSREMTEIQKKALAPSDEPHYNVVVATHPPVDVPDDTE